jgi:hypothetical protein
VPSFSDVPPWQSTDFPKLLFAGATPDKIALIVKDSARYMAEEPPVSEPVRIAVK